jgi:hypothetical protein
MPDAAERRPRDFVDAQGTRWEVTEWLAQHGDSYCLRFESPGDVREFCPAPDDWRALDDAELERLCRRGTPRERRPR